MPNYTFYNTITNEEETYYLSLTERDKFIKDNPHYEQRFNHAPGYIDPMTLGRKKPDDSFRDVLKEIKKKNSKGHKTKSTINTF